MNRYRPARIGDAGEDVAWAQRALHIAPATGMFDERTQARVRGYQMAHGLPVNGMLDDETVKEMHGG